MSYAALLNKYWLPAFEGKSVASIASADIKRVLAGYSVSNKTKKNALAVLSSIFNHAEIRQTLVGQSRYGATRKLPYSVIRPLSALRY